MSALPLPRSGRQIKLKYGPYSATVVSVGAALRTLRHGARDLIVPFAADSVRPCFHGSILSPWPNRLAGGTFTYEGTAHQLPVSEPERSNALHGLVNWIDWNISEVTPESVRLTTTLAAQPGYPFTLAMAVTYTLSRDGLTWSVEARNTGSDTAPYGVATHPYLTTGNGTVDDWELGIPARQILETSCEQLLPVSLHPVTRFADGALDFRTPRAIGRTRIDNAYTDIESGDTARACITVTGPDGHGAALEWDSSRLPWVQVFTSDLPEPELHRTGIAVEAMSCAPNAFNNGMGLVHLSPGARHHAEWTLRNI